MKEFMSQFADGLLDVLLEIPVLREPDNRTMLLRHLPPGPVGYISRHSAPMTDLNNIVMTVKSWGQLNSGEWALAIVARDALRFARGTQQGRDLESLLASMETRSVPVEIPPLNELVIGWDERLPISFLGKGLEAARPVARVLVPLAPDKKGYGTGWLVAPGLLMTNHHVIAVRDEYPAVIDDATLRAQALQAVVWFDYHERDRPYVEYGCVGLVAADPVLDYALLRLSDHPTRGDGLERDWGVLAVRRDRPAFDARARLNIIQHPQGGPKRLAIRSNFYVDTASSPAFPHRFHYVTDTEPGSSGSPVFDDDWQVVGLHAAAVQVPETQYRGEVAKYNNQGVFISAIIDHLPPEVRGEIAEGQGWK